MNIVHVFYAFGKNFFFFSANSKSIIKSVFELQSRVREGRGGVCEKLQNVSRNALNDSGMTVVIHII